MGALNVESLLGDYSPDAPSGPKLEELEYQSFETSTRTKPETQFGPAQEPNWRDVKTVGVELIGRSRDLRVMVKLAEALLHTEGWSGLADALELIRGSLENHWETVYPERDASENNDPWERVQAVGELRDNRVLNGVRQRPIVATPVTGAFHYLDIQRSEGHASVPEGETAPDPAIVNGAFLDVALDELQATHAAIARAKEAVPAIASALQEKGGDSPDLDPLASVLREIHALLADRLARRGVGEVDPGAAPGAPGAVGAAPTAPRADEINSREDVIRVLDKMCDYYDRNEPSSPIPMLLRRAKRLVNKSFYEVLQDLTPGAISEAQVFRGSDEEG